ncbi:MAG TPA: SIMPL domain-containing protein [Gaiellaceae bacterium]|jgi:uncharacterized protein YggE
MRRIAILLTAVAALAAVALLAGAAGPVAARGDTAPAVEPGTVTVSGHGSVDTVPDRATISAGVRVESDSAADALARTSAAVDRVIAALRSAGGKNLQTQQVSLEPQLSENGRTTGYVAQNTVTADAAISDAGKLIDAATAAGANTIEGPNLTVADSSALYRQALGLAVVDAKARAQALAKAGGFALGAVRSVSEQSSPGPIPFAAGGGEAAKSTPVEAGTQQVTADVQVVYAIG